MRELGRRGGSRSPLTKLRRNTDEEMREEARDVLRRAMRGEDVPKAALDSARSLFSYRADVPPEEARQVDLASEEALLARLDRPETWSLQLRHAVIRAAERTDEVREAIAVFTRRVRLVHDPATELDLVPSLVHPNLVDKLVEVSLVEDVEAEQTWHPKPEPESEEA